MKMIIVGALVLVAAVAAIPVAEPEQVQLVRSSYEQFPEGGYFYEAVYSNGITKEERGELREVPNEEGKLVKTIVVKGSYSQLGEDGVPVVTSYVADENGYEATGDFIPKPVEPFTYTQK